jgi:Carbohydrate kinase
MMRSTLKGVVASIPSPRQLVHPVVGMLPRPCRRRAISRLHYRGFCCEIRRTGAPINQCVASSKRSVTSSLYFLSWILSLRAPLSAFAFATCQDQPSAPIGRGRDRFFNSAASTARQPRQLHSNRETMAETHRRANDMMPYNLAQLSPSSLEEQARQHCFVPLSESSHKGSSGRIGVLGGSDMYTGAPYYAGMSALQAGADLAYVFTAREASLAIKSYSPELMVVPVYSATHFDQLLENEREERSGGRQRDGAVEAMVHAVEPWLDRMHCLIVGPGLGRCPIVMEATAKIIERAKSKRLALVVDASVQRLDCWIRRSCPNT